MRRHRGKRGGSRSSVVPCAPLSVGRSRWLVCPVCRVSLLTVSPWPTGHFPLCAAPSWEATAGEERALTCTTLLLPLRHHIHTPRQLSPCTTAGFHPAVRVVSVTRPASSSVTTKHLSEVSASETPPMLLLRAHAVRGRSRRVANSETRHWPLAQWGGQQPAPLSAVPRRPTTAQHSSTAQQRTGGSRYAPSRPPARPTDGQTSKRETNEQRTMSRRTRAAAASSARTHAHARTGCRPAGRRNAERRTPERHVT